MCAVAIFQRRMRRRKHYGKGVMRMKHYAFWYISGTIREWRDNWGSEGEGFDILGDDGEWHMYDII